MIDINYHPQPRELRWFGILQLPLFGLVAWTVYRRTGNPVLPGAIAVASVVMTVIGLTVPARLRMVYVGWMLAAFPIGWLVSHLLLAGIFYLLVTPVGIAMRCMRYDPMQLKHDRNRKTYWIPRPAPPGLKRYFRQF